MNKMKIYSLLLGIFIIMTGLYSCEDFLDKNPLGEPSTNDFYQSSNDMQLALNSVYQVLTMDAYQNSEWVFGEGCGDDMIMINAFDRSSERAKIMRFSFTPSNELLEERWAMNYRGIFRSNWVITKTPELYIDYLDSDASIVETDSLIFRQLIGQAKFLRALLYFNLVKTYGGVPIKPESLYVSGGTDNLVQARSSREEVYQYIEKDLREAILTLKDQYNTSATNFENEGKIEKGAAVALLIKVLAYQATPGQNHPKWSEALKFAEFLVDGTNSLTVRDVLDYNVLYPDESIAEIYYRLAIDPQASESELESAISPLAGKYGLNFNYSNIWNVAGEFQPGSIFEVNHIELQNRDDVGTDLFKTLLTWNLGDCNIIQPSTYFIENRNNQADFRLILSVYGAEKVPYEVSPKNPLNFPNQAGVYKWYTISTDRTLYHSNQSENQKNYRVMRFAEVVLFYAEALNETGDPSGAVEQLNKLRDRANLDMNIGFTRIGSEPMSMLEAEDYLGTRDMIRKERRHELCFEFDRFWDLVRQGTIAEAMDDYNSQISDVLTIKNFVPGVNEIFPIPQDEIDLSGGIVIQNPGY